MVRNPLSPFRAGGIAERGLGEDPFLSLHREMNRLFDNVFRGAGLPAGGGGQVQGGTGQFVTAPMNVSETEREIRITAELPGVTEQDIDISLNDDVLTIRGEKKFEEQGEKENFHFVERSYGTFQRSLRLPYPINPDQVQASFENGVLTIALPKAAQQERSRKIQVQSGGGRTGAAGGGQAGGGARRGTGGGHGGGQAPGSTSERSGGAGT